MKTFTSILVPFDFGEPSKRALELAIDLAKRNNAELIVLHVLDVPLSYAGMGISPADLLAPSLAAAREELAAVLAGVREQIPKVTSYTAQGVPWRTILATIEQEHIDLVVMGTHGHRGLPRAVLGSVAEKIVRLSPVPVLTVRAAGET